MLICLDLAINPGIDAGSERDKPRNNVLREVRHVIQVCERNHVKLMSSFPYRYLAGARAAKTAIGRGDIGEIIAFKGINRVPASRQCHNKGSAVGGPILDLTVHAVDLITWLLGSQINEVYAELGFPLHGVAISDTAVLHMRLERGLVGVLETSLSNPLACPEHEDIRFEIIGTEGVLSFDGFEQTNEEYYDQVSNVSNYWGEHLFQTMITDVTTGARDQQDMPTLVADGLNPVEAVLAAYESSRQKRPTCVAGLELQKDSVF